MDQCYSSNLLSFAIISNLDKEVIEPILKETIGHILNKNTYAFDSSTL